MTRDGVQTRTKSRRWDLNPRPFAYEANAITAMLRRQPEAGFEPATLCLQSRCNDHYATPASNAPSGIRTQALVRGLRPERSVLDHSTKGAAARRHQSEPVTLCLPIKTNKTTRVGLEPTRATPI